MEMMLVGSRCTVMLQGDELSIHDLPRSIFDRLSGFEAEHVSRETGRMLRVKHSALTDGSPVTFFCEQPPEGGRPLLSGPEQNLSGGAAV